MGADQLIKKVSYLGDLLTNLADFAFSSLPVKLSEAGVSFGGLFFFFTMNSISSIDIFYSGYLSLVSLGSLWFSRNYSILLKSSNLYDWNSNIF